jgi:outer membrane protein OmpA-like peptidoglycan-associated protein
MTEPPTTTPPAAQGSAKAEEFFIEPEAFEFESELDEYENTYENSWGESEGPFGEYERGFDEYQARAAVCPPYQRGEVEKSRTTQGHLPSDVTRPNDGGLLVTDFGVDHPIPKASLRRDAALRSWLKEIIQVARANPSTTISITGYSDCVGREKDNDALRLGRARQMAQLLQQLAGSDWRYLSGKVRAVAASSGSYIADNSTVQGRAQNRCVLIESKRGISFAPEPVRARFPAPTPNIEEDPEYIARVIQRARELFGRTGKWDQFGMPINEAKRQRILCLVNQIARSGGDMRYLTADAVDRYDRYVDMTEPEISDAIEFLIPSVRAWGQAPHLAKPGPKKTDKEIWRDMTILEESIRGGIRMINQMFELRQSAVSQRTQRLRNWVEKQMANPLSIYLCFK